MSTRDLKYFYTQSAVYKPTGATYLSYVDRRDVPPELVGFAGKKLIKRGLGSDKPKALKKYFIVHDCEEAWLASLVPPPPRERQLIDILTDAEADRMLTDLHFEYGGFPKRRRMIDSYNDMEGYKVDRPLGVHLGPAADFITWAIGRIQVKHGWQLSDRLQANLRQRYDYLREAQADVELWQAKPAAMTAKALKLVSPTLPSLAEMRVTLGGFVEEFKRDLQRQKIRLSSAAAYDVCYDLLFRHFGKDRDLLTISHADMELMVDHMEWLPLNIERHPEFNGKSLEHIANKTKTKVTQFKIPKEGLASVEIADLDNIPKIMAESTRNKYIGHITAMFDFAVRRKMIPHTPCVKLKRQNGIKTARKRHEFSNEQLTRLFHADMPRNNTTWMMVLMLFQCLRPGECAQLDSNDCYIMHEDGKPIWVLNISPETAGVDAEVEERLKIDRNDRDKSTKNDASKRLVPVHQQLLDWGFGDYVAARKAAGHQKLFDVKLQKNGKKGWSYYPHLWRVLSNIMSNLGVYEPFKTTLHSFRHTFAFHCRQTHPDADGIRFALGGWTEREANAEPKYGSRRFKMHTLKPYLDAVFWPDLFSVRREDVNFTSAGKKGGAKRFS